MRADWHIHSCLSPCASLDMSPSRIAREVAARGLGMAALTDHNSARNAPAFLECCRRVGIPALLGIEITTAEECHVLALFDNPDAVARMDEWVTAALPRLPLDAERFGDQPVVDADEQILEMLPYLLLPAIAHSLERVVRETHALGGLSIPSHLDRPSFSVESQLGFLPPGDYDAIEVSLPRVEDYRKRYPGLPVVTSSDAHFPEEIGRNAFEILSAGNGVEALRTALRALV